MTTLAKFTNLGLSEEQLTALREQGFVAEERRHSRIVFKLRFRVAGQQHVRVLGSDPARAAEMQAALQAWQASRRGQQELKALLAAGRALRRSIRPRLAEQVARAGFKFHGRRLRRSRAVVRASHARMP